MPVDDVITDAVGGLNIVLYNSSSYSYSYVWVLQFGFSLVRMSAQVNKVAILR
jgi:hypothetical protein